MLENLLSVREYNTDCLIVALLTLQDKYSEMRTKFYLQLYLILLLSFKTKLSFKSKAYIFYQGINVCIAAAATCK